MLLVHIERPTNRARYVIQHVVERMLGWEMRLATSLEEFRSAGGAKIHYGTSATADSFHIHSSGWLDGREITPFEPAMAPLDGMIVSFPAGDDHDVPAAVFHLLSRYEEHVNTQWDDHGRMPSSAHFVVRHGLERIPVVDHWVLRLAARIRRKYPSLPAPATQYSHTVTVDVDNGSKYLGRPLWRQIAAALRDGAKLDLAAVGERMSVLAGKDPDPFDVYRQLGVHAQMDRVDRLIAFILVQGGKRYDHAADPSHPVLAQGIRLLAELAEVGIHPSYDSSSDQELIAREKERLEKISGRSILCARQHFLRWRMPETLRALELAGIREDHTLGFSDRSGFRAGTCTPFQWYDLEQDRISDLVLHPFAVMDSALHDRAGYSAGMATAEFSAMSDAVRAVGGSFISVWHDRFLSGHGQWRGWPEVFHSVLEIAAK